MGVGQPQTDFKAAFSSRGRRVLGVVAVLVLVASLVLYNNVQGTTQQKLMMIVLALVIVAGVSGIALVHTKNKFVVLVYGVVGLGVAALATAVVLREAGFFGFPNRYIPQGPRQIAGWVAGVRGPTALASGDSLSFTSLEDFNDPTYRARVLAWIRANIHFDSITHGVSDRNYMDRRGTKGLIVPASYIHTTNHNVFGPSEGRIIWRIRLTGTVGYPQAGLPPRISHVLMDSLVVVPKPQDLDSAMVHAYVAGAVVHDHTTNGDVPRGEDSVRAAAAKHTVRLAVVARYLKRPNPPNVSDSTLAEAGVDRTVLQEAETMEIAGFARGIVIPEDTSRARVIRITVKRHYDYWWNRPTARWLGPGTYHPWSNCDTHGCCEGWCLSAC